MKAFTSALNQAEAVQKLAFKSINLEIAFLRPVPLSLSLLSTGGRAARWQSTWSAHTRPWVQAPVPPQKTDK